MKKQLKKLRSNRKKTTWKPHKIKRTPFIFAVFFGLVMVAYGLTYIFAATPPVIFSMSPTTQSATVGQTKTVALHINPNGDYVGGGGVRVTFDANRLTFNKFTTATGTPYNIFGQSSGAGIYTFSFYTNINTKQSATLGTLEFQVKPVPSTTQTSLAYASGIYTRAYKGNVFNPSYRTLQLSGASISVQVPVVQPPPPTPPPPTNNPTNPTNPTTPTNPTSPTTNPSNPTSKPSTSNSNQTPTATPTTNSPNQQPSTPSSENTDDPEIVAQNNQTETDPGESDDETAAEDTGQAAAPTKKKPPFIALAAVVGGIALIAGAAFIYFGLRRKHGKHTKGDSVHTGLFDDAHKPDKLHAKEPPAAPTHQSPSPTAASTAMAVPAAYAAASQKPNVPPNPMPPKPTSPPQPTHPPAQTPPPQQPPTPPAPPKPAQQPVAPPPQPSQVKPPQPTNPPHAIPAWQAQLLANQQPKTSIDEPEDMFELAAEHPESFGSSQLLDAEEAAKHPPKGPDAK